MILFGPDLDITNIICTAGVTLTITKKNREKALVKIGV